MRRTAALSREQPTTDEDLRAILDVCDYLIGRAGRTTAVMALRGSRAQRVLQFQVEHSHGYGYYAGVPEAEVLSRIDALIAEKILCLEYREGFPLLVYSRDGLAIAQRYAAENWLGVLRSRIQPIAAGAPLDLPFLMSQMPNRSLDTLHLLTDLVAREANPSWLPLLRAWQAVETRRVRSWLAPILTALEQA